jgi:two-component system cell cycle response regulator
MHVLIADDDPVCRLTLAAAVERLGHRCTLAHDGATAWQLFAAEHPDLLITDWHMPNLGGTELVQRVREHRRTAYAYVLVLIGQADEEDARQTMAAGADDLVRKPLRVEELECKLIAAQRVMGLYRSLHEDARIDALTGVGNRRLLAEDLMAVHGRAVRYGGTYGVAIADVDRFKRYNDGAGHPAGDEALRSLAGTLSASLRAGDGLYRFGGEEFVALLPEQNIDGAVHAARRWRLAVQGLAISHPAGGVVTISVGVAVLEPGETPDELLARADAALYRAKAAGGNRVAEGRRGERGREVSAEVESPVSWSQRHSARWQWHPRPVDG